MTPDERKQLTEQILYECVRVRSIAQEQSTLEVLELTDKAFDTTDPLNVMDVCQKMLERDCDVEPMELYNLLYLANQSPSLQLGFGMRGKPLPEPMEALPMEALS